jgi:hypothetical protein
MGVQQKCSAALLAVCSNESAVNSQYPNGKEIETLR